MPRKKKEPIMTGLSSDPDTKQIVQKANPLNALWRSNLSLADFKIMDAYLSRIDSHHPERRTVRFEKGEIERLLGVKKINISDLKERVQNLMEPLIITHGPRSFRGLSLFEQAFCEQDEITGLWSIDLTCTPKAMRYFFNIDNLGYVRYRFRCVSQLTSRYSYILFLYLESNRFRKVWDVGVDELKVILNCDNLDNYKDFWRFNDKILKRCHAELHEKTECRFSYKPIRKGRAVVAIQFEVETISDIVGPDLNQKALDAYDFYAAGNDDDYIYDFLGDPNVDIPIRSSSADLCREALAEFSDEEAAVLIPMVEQVPPSVLPYNQVKELQKFDYITQKINLMNLANSRKKIKNRFNYLRKMIQQDIDGED